MKQTITIVLLLLLISCKTDSEKTVIEKTVKTEEVKKELIFPDDFLGKYKGNLINTTSKGLENIPMEFHLLATTDSLRYDYKIFYGKEREERAYTLIQTGNKNIYELDENNGIFLPVAQSRNTLFSTYEVAGNLINNSEVFYKDRMDFMITMSSLENKEETGESAGYKVNSYPILVMQQATLYKIKEY
ncbi:hypothetical protein [uncultured Nonlabens sp.]|uniref:hypothetical protein n=1 Tax=uncultured Nonlabens sp. TaxID=859306 RepID=UPI00260F35BD|nr:hypothetical protein [uncultured Nonlabens sp.]